MEKYIVGQDKKSKAEVLLTGVGLKSGYSDCGIGDLCSVSEIFHIFF